MDKLRFFRSVCSWGQVLFAIFKVLALLGAIFSLLGVLTLSFMPAGFVKMDTTMKMDLRMEMEKLVGGEWEKMFQELELSDLGLGAENGVIDEKGVTISETVSGQSFENRGIALALIPTFVQLLLSFFLYGLISRVFKAFKTTPEPFRAEIKEDFQRVGWLLMSLGTVPAVCGSLISVITKTEGLANVEYDLFLVFSAFLVWAFSDLFHHGKTFLPAENAFVNPEEAKDEDINPNAF